MFYEDDECPVCGAGHSVCGNGLPDSVRIITLNFTPFGSEEMFEVKETVYEDRAIGDVAKVRVTAARAGSLIPKSEAIRLGLL